MAAAYNTLDTLLKSMPGDNATTLMKAFISRIEATTTLNNVEDAVDVADSYSSIFEKKPTPGRFYASGSRTELPALRRRKQ